MQLHAFRIISLFETRTVNTINCFKLRLKAILLHYTLDVQCCSRLGFVLGY